MSDILIKAVEEIVRNAKKVYEESVANLPLVEKATVCCTSSDPDDAVLEVSAQEKHVFRIDWIRDGRIAMKPMPLMGKQGLQWIRIWYALMADLSFR